MKMLGMLKLILLQRENISKENFSCAGVTQTKKQTHGFYKKKTFSKVPPLSDISLCLKVMCESQYDFRWTFHAKYHHDSDFCML